MILFWFIIICMTAVALSFVLPPLFQKANVQRVDREAVNIAIYHECLRELETEQAKNVLDQLSYQESVQELQQNLLADVPHTFEKKIIITQRSWITALFLLLMLPLLAITGYLKWGNSQQLADWLTVKQQAADVQRFREQLKTPQQVITILKQHLEQYPTSAQGWYLLGRLYVSQQQFHEAVNAFAKADALDPNNPDILFQYAQALYLTQHTLTGKPMVLLQKLLQLKPQDDLAYNLLAVAAFQHGDYRHAINYWERLLPHYSPESSDGKALLKAIASAQTKLASER